MCFSIIGTSTAELLQNAELAIQRSEIDMPKGAIKELGEHEIQIILHPQVRQSLKVVVTAEQVEDGASIEEESVS